MKITSKCEREFIVNCIVHKQKRLDGRNLLDGRTLEIAFGQERGCCMVLQGNTRVLAQVTAEVAEPKPSNPTEGALHVNLELSAMAAPEVKTQSRTSDEAVEAQRVLERCVRDSKCIDLESLCIVAGSKVWTIRVDIHTLNDDGNLVECSSIAAVSALAHFRRPDVIVVGTEVTVYSPEEREPVPLNLHHMPISINLALFQQGEYILVDPVEIEERVADGCYVIGMNAHQEICYVHRRGVLLLKEDAIQKCEDIAVRRAQVVTQIIRAALDDDAYKRATNATISFTDMIQTGTILGAKRPMHEVSLDTINQYEEHVEPETIAIEDNENDNFGSGDNRITSKVVSSNAKEQALRFLQEHETSVFEGGKCKWNLEPEDESEESVEEQPKLTASVKEEMELESEEEQEVKALVKEELESESEEDTVYIDKEELDSKSVLRRWYTKDPFS